MLLNSYRFAQASPGVIPEPLHWWDLDDDGTWADQGYSPWPSLTENGTVTVASGAGPGGQDVADFDRGNWLESSAPRAWDGAQEEFTVSIFAKLRSLDFSGTMLLSWRDVDLLTLLYARLADNAARVYDTSGNSGLVNAGQQLALSQWHHLCETWDGTTLKLYLDGSLIGQDSPASFESFTGNPLNFTIGSYSPLSNNFDIDGQLGMLSLFDEALSPLQVEHLYNNGQGRQYADLDILPVTIPAPLHWWDLAGDYADQGYSPWPDLVANGIPTTAVGAGPGGQDVVDLDRGDWLESPSPQAWDGGQEQVSFSYWAKVDSHDASGTMYISWRNVTSSELITLNYTYSLVGEERFRVYDQSANAAEVSYTPSLLPGVWRHFCVVWDGNTMRCYVDGQLAGDDSPSVFSVFFSSPLEFILGSYDNANNNDWDMDGQLFAVGIFDEALTPAQVQHLYNSGQGRQYADLDIS